MSFIGGLLPGQVSRSGCLSLPTRVGAGNPGDARNLRRRIPDSATRQGLDLCAVLAILEGNPGRLDRFRGAGMARPERSAGRRNGAVGALRETRGTGAAVKIVGWNIRAGGGARCEALAAQLRRWQPDVVAL